LLRWLLLDGNVGKGGVDWELWGELGNLIARAEQRHTVGVEAAIASPNIIHVTRFTTVLREQGWEVGGRRQAKVVDAGDEVHWVLHLHCCQAMESINKRREHARRVLVNAIRKV
jgi:hypothetical protein